MHCALESHSEISSQRALHSTHPPLLTPMLPWVILHDCRDPCSEDYLILIRPLHLRQAQEDLRQMNVGRLPQPLIDTFSGILPPPPAGSVEAFTMKCTLISMVLNTIAINALSQQLRRSVNAREVLAKNPGPFRHLALSSTRAYRVRPTHLNSFPFLLPFSF